jgi:hypothetical protein
LVFKVIPAKRDLGFPLHSKYLDGVYPFLIMFCHNRKIEAGCFWQPMPYYHLGKGFSDKKLVKFFAN